MGAWAIMAVNVALFGGCCFLVAQIVTQVAGAAIEPTTADGAGASRVADAGAGPGAAAPSVILDRNLFGAQLAGDVQIDETPSDEPLTKTKLPLRLLGTAAASEEGRSRAAIQNEKTRKHIVVAVGDEIHGFSRVTVRDIERTRVVLDNRGKPEELLLREDQPPVARRAAPTRQATRRKLPDEKTIRSRLDQLSEGKGPNLTSLLSQARIAPHFVDGEIQGMRVDAIKQGSLFENAGLINGDVITEVNGIVIDRQEATPAILDQLLNSESIDIRADRGGSAVRLSANPEDLMEQP